MNRFTGVLVVCYKLIGEFYGVAKSAKMRLRDLNANDAVIAYGHSYLT